MAVPADAAEPKQRHFFGVDIRAELKRRSALSNIGELPALGYGELLSLRAARGSSCLAPLRLFFAWATSDTPWRPDKASLNHAWEDGLARQRRYGVAIRCLHTARVAVYCHRIILAGEVAGA